jgi:hypothetical protein
LYPRHATTRTDLLQTALVVGNVGEPSFRNLLDGLSAESLPQGKAYPACPWNGAPELRQLMACLVHASSTSARSGLFRKRIAKLVSEWRCVQCRLLLSPPLRALPAQNPVRRNLGSTAELSANECFSSALNVFKLLARHKRPIVLII